MHLKTTTKGKQLYINKVALVMQFPVMSNKFQGFMQSQFVTTNVSDCFISQK